MVREAMNFAQKMTNERTQEAAKQKSAVSESIILYNFSYALSLYRSFYKSL